ncbi:Alpha/Beta hydrolase protein [Xylariomycetidae sp. FL2044]|nr:Alpha/Beta hydrolase protein [Xylariomycetidae sp. FL2044]
MPLSLSRLLLAALPGLASCAPSLERLGPRGDGSGSDAPPSVTLAKGTYLGVHNAQYEQEFFLGMPYAQPPTGSLRFAAPEPLAESWSEPRDASEYSSICIGYGSDTVNAGNHVSEDCLTLNVVRPAGIQEGDDLPVAVWVHGGSYIMGGSADPRYNLSFIVDQSVRADTPMIAVSINYRVSIWGFLFSQEMEEAGAGNVAFRDQRLALRWIQENIGAFGGCPDKVTVWGESAGARSLGMQLVAYEGRHENLFRGAILESGSPVAQYKRAADWQPYFDALAEKTGCAPPAAEERLACLRALPWETLNDIFNATGALDVEAPTLSAVIDHDFMSEQGAKLLREGSFAQVPLLLGNNFDEGTAYAKQGINTDAEFLAWVLDQGLDHVLAAAVALLYPDDASGGIPAFYEGRPPQDPWGLQFKRVSAFAGDFQQHSGRRLTAEAYAGAGLPVYSYLWNVHVNGIPVEVGATHFQEVAFVFDNTDGVGYAASPFEGKPETFKELADKMSRMWVAFITGGNPNIETGCHKWPLYTLDNPKNIVFDVNTTHLSYTARDEYRKKDISYILDKVFG